MITEENISFLRDMFNIDCSKKSPEELKRILDLVFIELDKNIKDKKEEIQNLKEYIYSLEKN